MDGFLSDVRHGLRMLVRTPLLSVVAILTIGLGVGAVTFASSVVYATIFRGPPVRDNDRLMVVEEWRRETGDQLGVPLNDFRDLQAGITTLAPLAAFYLGTVNVGGSDGPPERYRGAFVTAHMLSMLGVPPVLGRTFTEGDDVPGAPALAVIGFNAWRSRWGSDPGVIGKTIRVNGEAAEIIGVMPEGFQFPLDQDIWVPLRVDAAQLERRGGQLLQVIGYLREGTTLEAAQAEAAAIGTRVAAEHADVNDGIGFEVRGFLESVNPPELTTMMALLMAMVVGVLLIACANVANVLLARSVVREREVAVRSALGADRWRVIRQLLLEAVLLGVGGGIAGTAVAWIALGVFQESLRDVQKPYWIVFQLDAPVLIATTLVTLVAAVAAGIWPALRASGGDAGTILRDETRGSSGRRTGKLTHGLVIAELAVSCGLMIGAGLMIRALVDLNRVELGFEADRVMTARLGLFETDYPDPAARSAFYHGLLDRLAAEPGVESATLAMQLPGTGAGRPPFEVEGERYDTPESRPRASYASGTAGYFETFGIPLVAGRGFERSESELGGEPVAVVSESFVTRYLGGGSALGRRIRVGGEEEPWLRIVGVARDAHPGVQAFAGGGEPELDAIYTPIGQEDLRFMSVAVRSASGAPEELTGAIRRAVTGQDPNEPIYFVQTLRQAVDAGSAIQRIFGSLFGIFGGAALFLAAVGLYGVMDHSVASRTREMGVRTALGASKQSVFKLVLGRVALQLAVGVGLGIALGVGLAFPLASTFFGIEVWDAAVYGTIVAVMGLTGLLATIAPAWRAVRVDPVVALRA